VSAPRAVIGAAIERVAAFCEQRSTDDYRIEHTVRGASITIFERRPPWNPNFGTEWTSLKVAQLRYDDDAERWRLYSSGGDDRWHPYPLAGAAADVEPLLGAIEDDPSSIFWG
jgi:hypothetical protein